MADFAWGLQRRGHSVTVLSSDAPYLGPGHDQGPSGEPVLRQLVLKGSYRGGVQAIQDPQQRLEIDRRNQAAITALWQRQGPFDGVLLGNIDLLGLEVVDPLLGLGAVVLHHVGFVHPPFTPEQLPQSRRYQLVGASQVVSDALTVAGLCPKPAPVVYPGVRCDLFGAHATGRPLPSPLDGRHRGRRLGTAEQPLRVCFAGLLMGSKGAHTLVEALVLLKQQGIATEGFLAGGAFQAGYREQLEALLLRHGLQQVRFVGQLQRHQLARLFRLHHACVFPSIHPEAFGIVGAEAMASGLALVSSGAGGASELFEPGSSGLPFEAGNGADLAQKLAWLCQHPEQLLQLARQGEQRARQHLDVLHSAQQLEGLLQG